MPRSVVFIIILIGILIALTFFAVEVRGFHGDELVLNGSFEQGQFVPTPGEAITQGYKLLCGGSSSLPDWQVSKQGAASQDCTNAGDAVVWATTPNGNPGLPDSNITAQDGTRFLDLTGFAGKPPAQFGKVQQDVERTVPGAIYDLSFYIGSARIYPPPTPAPPDPPRIGIGVEVVGVPNATMSFDAPPTQDVSHWEQRPLQFTALQGATTIVFSGYGNPGKDSPFGGAYVGLDNVSLRRVCSLIELILDCR